MKKSLRVAVFLAGCVVLAMSTTTSTSTTTESEFMVEHEEEEDVFVPFAGERFDDFDWMLCKALDKREAGNIVVSPIGIKLVLAMLYEGAAGNTAREIQTTVRFGPDVQQLRSNFSKILASLQETHPEYVLDIGSKMYVDRRTQVRNEFNNILKTHYNSEIESINFSNPRAAANQINSWVDAVTHGRIQNLVSDDAMSSTVMLLVNAIFFKGLWRYPFNPEESFVGNFQSARDKTVQASYMKMSHKLYYMDATDIDAKIVRLPYMGTKYAMFIVLPNSPTGLKHLVNTINPYILRRHLWLMNNGTVNVTLPKFNFKYASDVTEVLKELGIKELFKTSASLPGILKGSQRNDRLFVSDVLQKAGLAVDEQGSEAYAATEVSVVNKFGDRFEFVFNATHPFMFFIEDDTTGTVIFVGKVVDPSNFVPMSPERPVSTTRRPVKPTTYRPPIRPKPNTVRPAHRPSLSASELSTNTGSGNSQVGNKPRPVSSNNPREPALSSGPVKADEAVENVQQGCKDSQGGNSGTQTGSGDGNSASTRINDTILSSVWKEVFSHRINN